MAHYEGGKLKVSAALLPQLAQLLNLSLDELLEIASTTQKQQARPGVTAGTADRGHQPVTANEAEAGF